MNIDLHNEKEKIINYYKELVQLDNEISTIKPNPDNWSFKEVIGHLIDSASNNHQRFIRLQHTDKLEFPIYDQNKWVSTSDYNAQDWTLLVELWKLYNLQLIHIIEKMNSRSKNNLWLKSDKEKLSLEYLIQDYFIHLWHHLGILRKRISEK